MKLKLHGIGIKSLWKVNIVGRLRKNTTIKIIPNYGVLIIFPLRYPVLNSMLPETQIEYYNANRERERDP